MQDLLIGEVPPKHYYGDSVRKLLLTAAIIILLTLPWLYKEWPMTFYVWLFLALCIGIFAGITNPKLRIVSLFDFGIAVIGFLFFGYEGIYAIQAFGAGNLLFPTAEILMLLFFFDLYFTVKTLRGMLLGK